MADRIKNYQQEADQITTLKAIRTDLGVTPSSYTPDATVVTKDRVVTFAQAEEELVVLGDIEKGVKQQVTEVDIAQKDIANIKALLQGHLYDYQTDSTSAYTKSVPAGAMPYAGLESLGGKTIVWNQLVDSGTTTVSTISGRKYYTLIDGTASIVTADGTAITIVDDTADMVCDLTLMFGAGNEPSTVEEFEAMFPADYYEHNAGTLLSAGVTEVESVGKNLVDIADATNDTVGGITYSYDATTKVITANGVQNANADCNITLATNIPIKANTTVTLSLQGTISGGYNPSFIDTANNYIGLSSQGNYVYTFTNASDRVIKTIMLRAVGTHADSFRVQVEKGSTATSYVPYMNPVSYPIPAAIRNLEGYGWSTGSVYNYIDFERKVFIKRVGGVDLGTLTWRNDSSCFGANMPSDSKTVLATGIYNILCSRFIRYRTSSIVELASVEKVMSVNNANFSSDKTVYIHDSSYPDAATFKTAMSGVYLYYELDTPVEVDISEYLTNDNLIQVEANGTLTFPNQNGTDYQIPVPSEETYMIDLQEAINNG